ncbi:PREDICTED: thrombomodulin, partial [Ficedula albicollis]|uniref:thrombomodulin n=1 Tax=Ficedula albicollis TaxID=59894 RepID=UPI0003592ECC
GAALAQPRELSPAAAQCLEHECFAVFWASRPFSEASEGCQRGGGHLMTVRSTVAEEAIALLLQNRVGRLWLGLSLSPSLSCTEPSRRLRGFRWVTGDRSTDYTNWAPSGQRCGERCVTVSRDLRWEERRCEEAADGFLCQYSYGGSCPRLAAPHAFPVTYSTPFGARAAEFLALPPRSTALIPALGLELRCEGEDIDDCASEPSPCEHQCVNTKGGFECRCHSGYSMVEGRCQPLPPCWKTPCQQLCQESPQGYRCGCHPGYALDPRNSTLCRPYCNATECPALCDDSGDCFCPEGFLLDGDDVCADIDECESDHCPFNCTNTPGGYQCHCPQGHQFLDSDCVPVPPEDVEEELSGDFEPFLPTTAVPSRPPPCFCPEGFLLDGDNVCADIDECESDHCPFNCTNTPGGYQCHCPQGHQFLDSDCVPVPPEDVEEELSGDFEPFLPTTAVPSRPPPKAEGLHPGVLVGIAAGALLSLLAVVALGYHLARKRCRSHGSMDYKYGGPREKELGLQPVPSAQKP